MTGRSAELAAQITAAQAVAADYARDARGQGSADPDWWVWAARLHIALTGVLGALNGDTPAEER